MKFPKLKLFTWNKHSIGFLAPDIDLQDPEVAANMSHAGLSLYCTMGPTYGGFGINWGKGIRICIGWVSFGLIAMDIEVTLAKLYDLVRATMTDEEQQELEE